MWGAGRKARPRPQGPEEPHQFALTPVAEAAEDDSDAKADGDDGRDQQDISGGCPWGGHVQIRPSVTRASHPPSAQSPPEPPPYPSIWLALWSSEPQVLPALPCWLTLSEGLCAECVDFEGVGAVCVCVFTPAWWDVNHLVRSLSELTHLLHCPRLPW